MYFDNATYPILSLEIAKRGIKKSFIAKTLGITSRAFSNKLSGKTQFTWEQICLMQSTFFPDMTKDDLLSKVPDQNKAS